MLDSFGNNLAKEFYSDVSIFVTINATALFRLPGTILNRRIRQICGIDIKLAQVVPILCKYSFKLSSFSVVGFLTSKLAHRIDKFGRSKRSIKFLGTKLATK